MRIHWLVVLVGFAGCASSASSSALPLRKVVLYRSGMGHFEHAGKLKSSHLQLRLRSNEVDDVIKTIAVTSKDDGAVLGAVAALKPRGTEGDLSLDLTVASSREITLSYAVPTPTWRSTHRLVLGEGDSADSALLQTWEVNREDRTVPSRIVKIERGAMTLEDRKIRRTSYEVAAGDSAPARIFVRHEVTPGYRISQLPTGTVEGGEAHLVPFSLRAAARTILALEEEQPAQRLVRPLDGHKVDLELYLKGSPNIPAPIAEQLRRAAAIQTARSKLSADEAQSRRRLEDSSRRVSELRESLLSIEKNPTAAKLRGELTQRLTQATRSHEELEKKLAQLGAENDEKRAQLRTILEDLTLEETGPSAAR